MGNRVSTGRSESPLSRQRQERRAGVIFLSGASALSLTCSTAQPKMSAG